MREFLFIILSSFMLVSCTDGTVKEYGLEVVAEYPHDTESYTQGLFFENGQMYESTGLKGKSTFRKVDLATGKALEKLSFDRKYFVEGSVMLNGSLYVLTWDSRCAFVYDAGTLEYKSSWRYPREGWGLTTDGKELIASDGSANLYFMDGNFSQKRKVLVTLDGRPIRWLNELEYIDGKIWANVYTTDEILIINPKDGKVQGVVDCRGLLPREMRTPDTDVLNGIAYDEETGKIYITGKNWPKLYEIRLKEK
ncbi:MAG: glutaminyl-peptide cyclotransferase [Bacteroidales bacterium]|nr:glutaminyl-peptide cyclotransferase [Bacteroidales bacterium]MBQ6690007.1 glutaminyl-peptide cyclotransferase [Bacteroidales bacterium]